MGEEYFNELYEYVFRDIRIIDDTKKKYQIKIKEAINLFHKYKNKVKIYRCVMGEIFSAYPDAERWDIAFESYTKKYECLKNGYIERNGFLWYVENGKEVKITADILTGPIEIIRIAEKLGNKLSNKQKKEELLSVLDLFCSVAYTVGNCCPAMFNPLPKAVGIKADTCWLKLQRFINPGKEDYKKIQEYKWNDNLRYRGKGLNTKDNMFGLFSEQLSGKKIIERLMLNDYYDDDYNLIIQKTPQEYADDGVDTYISFMKLVTALIIKRGIRIYKQNDLGGINIDKMAVELINEKIRIEGWEMEFECK